MFWDSLKTSKTESDQVISLSYSRLDRSAYTGQIYCLDYTAIVYQVQIQFYSEVNNTTSNHVTNYNYRFRGFFAVNLTRSSLTTSWFEPYFEDIQGSPYSLVVINVYENTFPGVDIPLWTRVTFENFEI